LDVAGQLQQELYDRLLIYGGIVWVVVAICVGLWASEFKKRRFWTWVLLSLLTGPVAWYLLLFRVGMAVPKDLRVSCPRCGRTTRKDMKLCIHCRAPIDPKAEDRATNLGRQAATWLFAVRRAAGSARKAADDAARARAVRSDGADKQRTR